MLKKTSWQKTRTANSKITEAQKKGMFNYK